MLTEKIQLEADERILVQVRKHWFILFTRVFSLTLAALIPLLLAYALFDFAPDTLVEELVSVHAPQLTFIYLSWLLIIWMMLGSVWTDYYLDVWTVTNRRIIVIDQRGLFRRSISSFRLERLQDMNVEIDGIIATFLDFGTLEAQTAGHSGDDFRAHGLPKPRELKATILKAADDLIDEYRNRPRLSEDGV